MGERPDRPEELRRDPLGRPDPLGGESERDVDRADAREEKELEPPPPPFTPEMASPDPALARAPVGAEEVDEVEANRAEIERTRADMSETVDAIQNKLSPRNLKEQAKEQAKDTAKGAGSTIMETIRENPLPAALTGIGLGWLFVSARRSSSSSSEQEARYRGDRAYDYPPTYDRVPPEYDYQPGYEERASSGPATAQEALERVQGRVGETASQAQARDGQAASQAQDRVSQLGSRAQERARRAGSGFQRMLQENPLTVGALAVGVGAAVGLAVPQTSQEHEAMGEARDSLVEKAQEKAQEAQQRVQRVAEEAQSAAKEEAQNQDLT